MRAAKLENDAAGETGIPWAMHLQAIALEEPDRLIRMVTGAIVGCGGWLLSRGANDTGTVTFLFEFERHACVDIYGGLVGAGIELTRNGHLRLTELCQCTRSGKDRDVEIASIDLEVQTYPFDQASQARATPM